MKVKALKDFNDGWATRTRRAGEIFDVTQEGYEYFASTSLIVPVCGGRPDLDSMTKKEIVAYAESEGISGLNDRMLKADIIAAIKGAMGWM